MWHPEASSLEKLRDDIDQRPHVLKRALMSEGLRRDFFKGGKDEKAVVSAFVSSKMNAENALKTKPKVSSIPTPLRVLPSRMGAKLEMDMVMEIICLRMNDDDANLSVVGL